MSLNQILNTTSNTTAFFDDRQVTRNEESSERVTHYRPYISSVRLFDIDINIYFYRYIQCQISHAIHSSSSDRTYSIIHISDICTVYNYLAQIPDVCAFDLPVCTPSCCNIRMITHQRVSKTRPKSTSERVRAEPNARETPKASTGLLGSTVPIIRVLKDLLFATFCHPEPDKWRLPISRPEE